MNILFICDEYPPGAAGGIGTAVQILARELSRQGNRVFVAGLYPYWFGGEDRFEDQGVSVYRLRYGPDLGPNDKVAYKIFRKLPAPLRSAINGAAAFSRFTEFINELVKKENISIIEIADWNTFAVHMGSSVRWPQFSAPLVLKSHGSYTKICHDLGKRPSQRMRRIDQSLYDRADGIAAVSQHAARLSEQLFGKKNIRVLYNGVHVPPVSSSERKEQEIVYSGSLTKAKGIHQLMKAWNIVTRSHPSATLSLYGKGKSTSFSNLLATHSRNSVKFRGAVTRDELLKVLCRATVAVYPSYSETFGLAAVEAMSTGCPVVFSRRSCGPEIITDGYDGMLVDPDKPEEIADAIITLLEDPHKAKMLGGHARDTVEKKFSAEVSARANLQFYNEVIAAFKNKQE